MSLNCGKQYLFLHKSTKEGTEVGLIPAMCKSWSCKVCRKRKSELVRAHIKKSFIGQNAWMHTITFFHSGTALDAWKNIGKNLNRLLTYARKYSGSFSYCRVVEPHKDGSWPHIHMVTNKSLASTKFVKLITQWGFGWNYECEPMSGDKAGNYMAKYLTKEWPQGDADLLRTITKTRIVSSSRSLGPIFSKPPTWTLVNLPNPFRQLPAAGHAVVNELHKNGATEIVYTPIAEGFIIKADSSLSREFLVAVEDQLRWDPLEAERYSELSPVLQNAVPF